MTQDFTGYRDENGRELEEDGFGESYEPEPMNYEEIPQSLKNNLQHEEIIEDQ